MDAVEDIAAASPLAKVEAVSGDGGGQDSGGPQSAKAGKNLSASRVICHSILNSINKTSSQIKKLPHRRSVSPLNWFPRKKTDSLLERKIKILQQSGGMKPSLDETLGDSNPHYCKIEREKMAAREAAQKVMEARKAAMVEASWYRILRAARVPTKDAEHQLELAEKNVAKAFEEATAMGVILYDRPDCPRRPSEVESSPTDGGKATHAVAASFETAFEVDKEVGAAVKTAFLRLANAPSSDQEFHAILRKISQNPDLGETNSETVESEPESRSLKNLVVMMHDRLKCLKDDELASLATIVATCGLNAALHAADNGRDHDNGSIADDSLLHCQKKRIQAGSELPSLDKFLVKHVSRLEKEVKEAKAAKKCDEVGDVNREVPEILTDYSLPTEDLPGLDKCLVKHVSKLEREIQAAKAMKKGPAIEEKENSEAIGQEDLDDQGKNATSSFGGHEIQIEDKKILQLKWESDGSLGELQNGETMIAEKNLVCTKPDAKFDEQICKENVDLNLLDLHQSTESASSTWPKQGLFAAKSVSRIDRAKQEVLEAFSGQQSLDTLLIKHVSSLEKEKTSLQAQGIVSEKLKTNQECEPVEMDKFDKMLKTHASRLEREQMALIKHVSRHEKVKMAVNATEVASEKLESNEESEHAEMEGLDKVLVKHVSRLEKEKMALRANEGGRNMKDKKEEFKAIDTEGLDKMLVKHVSRLEKEKMAAAQSRQEEVENKEQFESRRQAREKELMEAWGGLSLGHSVKPHLSKLEKDKAAWKRAEEEERRRRAREQ